MNSEWEVVRRFLENANEAEELWDSEAIIWVENEEKTEDIIEYFNLKMSLELKVESLENNRTNEDDILLEKDSKLMRISFSAGNKNDITITYLNDFIKQGFEIRWFMETLCGDALAFVLLTRNEWKMLEDEFGEIYVCHYFEPLSLKKKMFALKREQSLLYRNLKERNKAVPYKILLELSELMIDKNKIREKLESGEIGLESYILENRYEKRKIKRLIKENKIYLNFN